MEPASSSAAGRLPRWWDVRPVEIPDDVDDAGVAKARGRVRLPHHVRWSSPLREYDLGDPADRNSATPR